MPRSSSSSSSASTDRTSSNDEVPVSEGATSRRRRTTSEQSGGTTSNRSEDRSTRKTRRSSPSQSDDKSTKQRTRANRGRDDDGKATKTKNDDRRRKTDLTQQERGEKRHGDSSTSHKAKSSKEVDYSQKPSKPEPKFEPRISMYKYDPMQGCMCETAQYNDHRQRLSRARSLIDNKPPPNFGHVQQNMRKLKDKQEREDEIEKGNQRLLERLVKAMTTKRVDNWNEVDNRLVKASREKERERILEMAAENRKIAQRIESRQSTISNNREARAAPGPSSRQPQRPAAGRAAPRERPGWQND